MERKKIDYSENLSLTVVNPCLRCWNSQDSITAPMPEKYRPQVQMNACQRWKGNSKTYEKLNKYLQKQIWSAYRVSVVVMVAVVSMVVMMSVLILVHRVLLVSIVAKVSSSTSVSVLDIGILHLRKGLLSSNSTTNNSSS